MLLCISLFAYVDVAPCVCCVCDDIGDVVAVAVGVDVVTVVAGVCVCVDVVVVCG